MKKIYPFHKWFVISTIFLLCSNYVQAQNIFPSTGSAGIGTATPNASSILDMVSTSKGMLMPRMTITQRDAIVSPATGLIIYQTNSTPGFYYYNGSAWAAVKAKGWSLTGNSGTNPATNFLGTTDAQPLIFKINNQKAGYLGTSSTTNTGFGYQTLNSNTTGVSNTANGYQAMYSNTTGAYNSANGVQALYVNTSGHDNTANGFWSLLSNTIGYYNTATGGYALYSNLGGIGNTANGISALRFNTNGSDNTAAGANTLFYNTTGYSNVAIGSNALFNNTAAHNLVAIGDSALYNQSVNGFGDYGNTAIGSKTLYSNTVGSFNTATGFRALYSNAGYAADNTANGAYALTSNTYGFDNTASGNAALSANTTGSSNTATGAYALVFNTSGSSNTTGGFYSLYRNTTGYSNTALGISALFNNTIASNNVAIGDSALYSQNGQYAVNTAVGSKALYSNINGTYNLADGNLALYHNDAGYFNTASGYAALYRNTGGYGNTALGADALSNNINGYNNTVVGSGADVNNASYSNSSAFGYQSLITASNQVRIGDINVTSIGGYRAWTNLSDGRVKKNIKENVPGLAFINLLKPITYNLDLDEADKIMERPVIKDKNGKPIQRSQENINARRVQQQVVCTGFVAQDVEATAKKIGYDFDGVDAAKNSKDLYGLRYSEFVVPLVKAVQELSKMNDVKDAKIYDLETRLAKLEAIMNDKQSINNIQHSTSNISTAFLAQNIPNPFSNTTTISYSLPQNFKTAQIIVTDKTGKVLKQLNVSSGKGSVQINAATLSSGAYQYSLLVDGKLIDTKQMILTK
jgi:trimeric autotransporter adhesin